MDTPSMWISGTGRMIPALYMSIHARKVMLSQTFIMTIARYPSFSFVPFYWCSSVFLPPATKFGEGNIFRSMCQQFRGTCMVGGGVHDGRHAWQGVCDGGVCGGGHAWQQGYAWQRGYAWQGCMHGRGVCIAGGHAGHACPPSRYYEIRSMSGRYASYWNAFFFLFLFSLLYFIFSYVYIII